MRLAPSSPPRLRSRTRGVAAATVAGLLVPLLPLAALADTPEQETVTVTGTIVQVAVERGHPALEEADHAEDEGLADGLVVETFVDVDGSYIDVPEELAPDAATGTEIELTLAVEGDLSEDEAVAAAADGDSRTAQLVEAQVVEVQADAGAPTGAAGVDGAVAAGQTDALAQAVTAGARRLIVLPVHFGTPDGATTTSITEVVTRVRTYWSDQSGGAVAIQPDVRGWKTVADPGCDTSALMTRALAAHGVSAPAYGSTDHVLVYFPRRSSCGTWAGMAAIDGNTIWINGVMTTDVVAHEFGHNLGLGHANTATCSAGGARTALAAPLAQACTLTEYGDRADVMGIGTSAYPGSISSGFADFLGFGTIHRPAPFTTTTVDLTALREGPGGTRGVAVPVLEGTVYLSFRPNLSPDTRQPAWAGVQAHLRTMNTRYGYPTTYLLDMKPTTPTPFSSPSLAAGASWQVPGTATVIKVESVGTTARISVDAEPVENPLSRMYVPTAPTRVYDARAGVAAGAVQCVQIAGTHAGVPTGAAGVVLNVATVGPRGPGHVVVYPDPGTTAPSAAPDTATVNFDPGRDVANAAMIQLPASGRVCYLIRGATAGIVIDVNGYTLPSGGVTLKKPVRLHDRSGVVAGQPFTVQVTGSAAGVPAGAKAVVLNVAGANSQAPGNLKLYAAGSPAPSTSTLNYSPGGDKSNAAIVALSSGGALTYVSDTQAHNRVRVVLDVVGYSMDGSSFVPIEPKRLLDTRKTRRVAPKERLLVSMADASAIPAGATAAVLNVVAVLPTGPGNLQVFPYRASDGTAPGGSTLNYIPGQDVANMAVVGIGDNRSVTILSDQVGGADTHVVVDAVGYFTNTP